MDLRLEEQSCCVCHAYLFEDDDVVYCPECGAPHHRECYSKVGHCGLEGFHGTDEQYDLAKQRKTQTDSNADQKQNEQFKASGNEETVCCSMCNKRYDFTADACPHCATPNLEKYGEGFMGYDFLGGIPADYVIDDGVTAEEAKRFVMSNTPRYVKKFAHLSKSNKASWNWLAFIFPNAWLLARKMYKGGIIVSALMIAASLLTLPLNLAVYNMSPVEATGYADMMQYVYDFLPQISVQILVASLVGAAVNLVIRFIVAIFGDYFYKKYVVNSIRSIKAKSEDKAYDFRKKGGINLIAMLLGIMAVNYIPAIIMNFIV